MRRALAGLAALVVLAAAGCSADDVPTPAQQQVDVDTPDLVTAKAEAGVADCVPGTGTPVAGGLPAITLPCFGGGPEVDLSTLRGPMVVNLWASWCGPCRDELPLIQSFFEHYGDQVGVLGVDYLDPQTDAAMELVAKSGVAYPLLADPDGDLSAQDPLPVIPGLPYLLFVDADGAVAFIKPGQVDSEQELVDLVEEHLGITL